MIKDAAPSLFFAICEVTVHAFGIDVGLEARGCGNCSRQYFLLKLNFSIYSTEKKGVHCPLDTEVAPPLQGVVKVAHLHQNRIKDKEKGVLRHLL